MACVSADNWKHPSWSRVGMEITPEELRKVLEFKEKDISALYNLPDVGCIILILGMASLVVYIIFHQIKRRSHGQAQDGALRCKGDTQKLQQDFELQEQVLIKMDSMEQRLTALEEFLRCMWRRKSRNNGKTDSGKRDTNLPFSDCSD